MKELQQLLKNPLAVNVLMIVGEVSAVIAIFVVFGFILRRFVNSLAEKEVLQRFKPQIEGLRRNLRWLLVLSCLGVGALVAGVNAYFVYRGEYLPEFTLEKIRSIPPSYWRQLGIALAKISGMAFVTFVFLRLARKPLAYANERLKLVEGVVTNDESLDRLFGGLERTLTRGAWLGMLVLTTILLGLPDLVSNALTVVLKLYLILSLGLLCWRALDSVIESLNALSQKYSETKGLISYYERLKGLVTILRRTVEYVIYLATATLMALQVEGIAALAEWGPRLIQVLGLFFFSRVVIEVLRLLVEEFLIERAKLTPDQLQRRRTIVPLIQDFLKYLVYFGMIIAALKVVGIDPLPILAGAGIVGLAVGLGAQNLVNDLLSGFFILFENYYLVGDYIRTESAEGVVETIDIRTTRIRDEAGRLHILRNGSVGNLINFSKGFANALVDIGVAYESDLNHVYAVLEELGAELAANDPEVLAPTVVQGVDSFGASEIVIRTVTKVAPGRHKVVERRLRKRIKEVFDEREIDIPFSQHVVRFLPGEAPAPARVTAS